MTGYFYNVQHSNSTNTEHLPHVKQGGSYLEVAALKIFITVVSFDTILGNLYYYKNMLWT